MNNIANLAQSVMQMLPNFRNNPITALLGAGFNVPNGMNNPQEILNHLVKSGQLSQGQLDYAQKMANQLGFK